MSNLLNIGASWLPLGGMDAANFPITPNEANSQEAVKISAAAAAAISASAQAQVSDVQQLDAVAIVFEFNPFEYMGTNASVSGKVS